jgi:excisionase family DNA binding protein
MDPNAPSDTPLLLKVNEAASQLQVGRTTVYGLIQSGEIRCVRIGRAVRIPRRALEEYADRIDFDQNA